MGTKPRFHGAVAAAALSVFAACGGGHVLSEKTQSSPTWPPAVSSEHPPASAIGPTPRIGVRAASIAFDATPLAKPDWSAPVAPAELPPSAKPSVRPYALPLSKRQVTNLERDLESKQLVLDRSAVVERLLREGMALGNPTERFDQFSDAYRWLSRRGVPVTVTVDSLLHFQHVYFAELLKAIETRELAPMLRSLLTGIEKELVALGEQTGGPLAEPALRELAYVSVALSLLDPRFRAHPDVAGRVGDDLARIERHRGISPSSSLSTPRCLEECYREDFSQYVPRGHYTQSDALRRYFKASMWLGRIVHRAKENDEILQQLLLVQAVKRARCNWADRADVPAAELIGRIDRVLDLFVGETDDLDVFDLDRVQAGAVAAGSDIHAAANATTLERLRGAIRELRAPRILSNVVPAYGEDANDTIKTETQGLRLLGQRYAQDSELLGRLVWEFVGPNPTHPRFRETVEDALKVPARTEKDPCAELTRTERDALEKYSCASSTPRLARCLCERATLLHDRCLASGGCPNASELDGTAFSQVCRLMPTALDVAAVLGSKRAQELTAPGARYCGFAEQRRALQAEWKPATPGSNETLYAGWLRALRPLFAPVGAGYPTYMYSRTYQDKSLRTALASWTELRHDTVLYVKQSYTAKGYVISGTMTVLRDPKFYATVEPRSDVIRSLRSLVARTRGVLGALSVLSAEIDSSLGELDSVLGRLQKLADRALKEQPLEPADADWLTEIGEQFDSLITHLALALVPLSAMTRTSVTPESLREATRVTLVTDVHTDPHTERVLEQALGRLELAFFVTRNADGKLSVSAGPVFSHREFVHKMSDRLTNEKWRELVERDAVEAPGWWKKGAPLANGYQLFCTEETPGCAKAAGK